MRSPLFLLIALAVLAASAAHAGGVDFAWTDCITQPTQTANVDYACDGSRNGIPFRAVTSFVPFDNLAKFVGFQAIIDITLDFVDPNPVVPDWWRLAVGECRDGNLAFPTLLTGVGTGSTGVCVNPWIGANTDGGYLYCSAPGSCGSYPWPGYARLLLAFARDTAIPLQSGQQYLAGAIGIDTYKDQDTGDGRCAGCCVAMRLDLTQIELYQEAGTPPQDIYVLNIADRRQRITWQSGVNPSPCVTPVRRRTWGSIKTTYR